MSSYELDRTPRTFTLGEIEHGSVLVEYERSYPPNSGVAGYVQGGLGIARLRASGSSYLEGEGSRPERPKYDWGPALSGEVGLRLVPPPGPIGFLLGLRSSNALTPHSSSHVLAFQFGLTVHPL